MSTIAAKNDQSAADCHKTPVPLLDVSASNAPLREQVLEAFAHVYDSGRFIYGPDCQQLEQSVARLCAAEFGVGCASGSDALLLALMALRIGPGDEVLLPSFTFFATASAIWRLGAKPVFVDIDSATFNIDPESAARAVTPATKAIIPVHLFGQCAEMDAINELASRYELAVVEDAAQALGAKFRGRPAGGLGHVGCFSFYPTKNLGGLGDGGMLTTSNADLADRLRLLANHGMRPRYYHSEVGINSRLDSLQAAALNVKLKHLDGWTTARRQNAERYTAMFAEAGLDDIVTLPRTADWCEHVWNQFTIRIGGGRRDEVRRQLTDAEIGSEIYYPIPMHQQECFRSLGDGAGSLPRTDRAATEVLSLPIYPEINVDDQRTVVTRLTEILRRGSLTARIAMMRVLMFLAQPIWCCIPGPWSCR